MRPSSSVTELPSLGVSHGATSSSRSTSRRTRGAAAELSRLHGAQSAPSLHSIKQRTREMRNGVETVVSKLTERPGVGPLLLLHEQEHAAGILKALGPRRASRGPPAPRLMTQPDIKLGALNTLARRSHVLSQIADELGAAHSAAHHSSLFLNEDLEQDDDEEVHAHSEMDGAPQAGRKYIQQVSGRAGSGRIAPTSDGWGAPGSALMATHDPLSQQHPLRQQLKSRQRDSGSRAASREAAGAGLRRPASRGTLPAVGMLIGSAATSSLHASRAAASRSAAQLDTKIENYLTQYRLAQRMDDATTFIQSAWRGHTSRHETSEALEEKRAQSRTIFRAWLAVITAQRYARSSTLERAFFGWLREQRETRGAANKLAYLLQRSIGASPAFAYWRIVLDKRKRVPRPLDCPTVEEALGRCLLMMLMKKILHEWRRHLRRAWVFREQAAQKIQSAARPMHLWPSEVLSLALLLWSRIAKYHSCLRRGVPPPVYLRYVQQWHEVCFYLPSSLPFLMRSSRQMASQTRHLPLALFALARVHSVFSLRTLK